jgi:chromosomal replication initiator protein
LIECDPLITEAFSEALRTRIGNQRFALWFENKTKLTWRDDQMLIGVPNLFYQEWLERTFAEDIRLTASELLGQAMQVRFAIDPALFQAERHTQQPALAQSRPAENDPAAADEPPARPAVPPTRARQRRWRSLDDFVVGPCNRVAHAAALYVVDGAEQGANPLLLHGPVGTGKTHLLEGICLGLRQADSSARVIFTTSEEFTNRFLHSMRNNSLGGFRKHFRDCDVLLFDDLQFLANKPATQEEFLYTLNALQRDERHIVVTMDCHPRLCDQLMPELTDRLIGGAIWGLQTPDLDARLRILELKWLTLVRERREALLPPEPVLRYLAENLQGNVRELEGALHSLFHYARVTGKPIDLAAAREVLSDLLRHSVRLIKIADVDRAVCQALRLDAGALRTRKRAWQLSHPRMLAIYLSRRHTRATYADIGRHFGNRNHSTAVAAEKKVRQWLQDDAVLSLNDTTFRVRDVIDRIERELHG